MARPLSRIFLIVFLIILAGLVAGFIYVWPRLEGSPPEISLDKPLKYLGREQRVYLKISDSGRGLAWVRVTMEQKGKQGVIINQEFEAPGVPLASLKLMVKPLQLGMNQGPATLVVEAADRSWRRWLKGNRSRREFPVQVDTTPPRISSLTQMVRIRRGGSGLAVYLVDEPQARHGVRVGKKFYLGVSPWPDKPNTKLCYFAYGEDQAKGQKIELWAMDVAGNAAAAALNTRVHWKRFKSDNIKLSDRTLRKIAARFDGVIPQNRTSLLAKFIWINQDLRQENHQVIEEASRQSQPYQLWRKTFARSVGAPKAGYGDRRTFFYKGKEVSKGVHLGADTAHTEKSPVKASARGIVRLAAKVGIYGNCVILSHGQGLATLYAHLSSMAVKVGDEVQRGQDLGRSGATGLALGDHLHFSVLVQGVYVNPTEWWDPRWVRDNVLSRFKEAGLPLPLPPGETQPGS